MVAIDVDDGVAAMLDDADSVIIVPGYGMAVAQAQQSVSELVKRLRAKNKKVRFGIHPVAGPPPGPHERAARRVEGALRHRPRDGRDQPTTSRPPTSPIVIGSNDIVNPGRPG